MIVTCPSCSTKYNVPPVEIGIEGRQVRCKKCGHSWLHEGERKVLDDLISRIQASDIDVDIAFDDPKQRKKEIKTKLSLFSKIKETIKNLVFSDGKASFLSHCAGFMVALAIFSVLCFVLVSQRWGIVRIIPSLTSVYEATGFPLVAYANVNPEDMLIIEKPMIQVVDNQKAIHANLINLSSGFVRVPSIKISYIDANNNIVAEDKETLPIPMIQKEFSYGFHLKLPDNMPDTVKTIRLNFVD
jgi:predicted Zn finger-like uncharacterized protein